MVLSSRDDYAVFGEGHLVCRVGEASTFFGVLSPCGDCPFHALKVHKRENFLSSDFEICTFSQLVMHKC